MRVVVWCLALLVGVVLLGRAVKAVGRGVTNLAESVGDVLLGLVRLGVVVAGIGVAALVVVRIVGWLVGALGERRWGAARWEPPLADSPPHVDAVRVQPAPAATFDGRPPLVLPPWSTPGIGSGSSVADCAAAVPPRPTPKPGDVVLSEPADRIPVRAPDAVGTGDVSPLAALDALRHLAEIPEIQVLPSRCVTVPAPGRVVLMDVRGAAVGDHVKQFNLYTFHVTTAGLDLGARLDDSDVRHRVDALARDPQDEQARRDLVDALTACPLLGAPDNRLTITSVRATGGSMADSLDGMVLVWASQGVVAADHATVHSEFVYAVAPSGTAKDLLAGNPALAKALVDVAIPATEEDTARLERVFADTVAALPLDSDAGVDRGVHEPAPKRGATVLIRRADGVLVGDHSHQHNSEKLDTSGIQGPGRVRRRRRKPEAGVGHGKHFGLDPPQPREGPVAGTPLPFSRPGTRPEDPPNASHPGPGL